MSDENNAASQEPAADLDSIIDNAIEANTPKDDAPAAEPAVEASPEPKVDATGRLHAPDGKFAPKPKDEVSAVPAASEPEPTAEAATPVATPSAEPALQPVEPPARLTPEDKAVFAQLPREQQELVAKWYKGFEGDHTRKTQEVAELRRSAEPILNAVKPFQQYLTQLQPIVGQTPDQMIGSLLGVEYQLRTGDPWQKAQALQHIAQSYGIDLAALTRGELPAAPDPAYQQLRQSFSAIEQEVATLRRERELEQQRETEIQIETFKSAKDSTGRPLHPHFDRVRGVMGQILRDDPSMTLDAAYAEAIKPIQEAIEAERKAAEEAAEQARIAAVEKAKKAAPVKTSGSAPNGQAKSRNLDDMLWENINARL
jgi:hypothetical protein